MRSSTLAIALCTVLAYSSCDKAGSTPEYNDWPVIEGYLYEGLPVSITVSQQVASGDIASTGTEDINALNIILKADDSEYILEPVGNGVYENKNVIITTGKTYQLSFSYNNKDVVALTTILSKPTNFEQSVDEMYITKIDSTTVFGPGGAGFEMNDPLELTWTNNDNSYYMVVAQNMAEEPELIRDTSDDRFPTRVFRNEPEITNEYQIMDRQFLYYGMHMLLLYHLNPDYAALYTDNSNSSQNLKNPSTNITNAYGIFTGISADTLYIDIIEQ